MGYLTENVIPGEHGKVFGTNAKEPKDIEKIMEALSEIEGIAKLDLDTSVHPVEITVLTSKMVEIKKIEDVVNHLGFHVVPKGYFDF